MAVISNQLERGILVVDDDQQIRDTFALYLRRRGFTKVFTAVDSLEALTSLDVNGEDIYVILLDVVMPGMDGFRLSEYLANNYHRPTGIIFMSAYQDRQREFNATSFGDGEVLNFDYFAKPLNFAEVINKIMQCGDLIFNRRISVSRLSLEMISDRLDGIKSDIDEISSALRGVRESRVLNQNIFEDLGREIVKIIIISLFVVLLLKGFDLVRLIHAAGG